MLLKMMKMKTCSSPLPALMGRKLRRTLFSLTRERRSLPMQRESFWMSLLTLEGLLYSKMYEKYYLVFNNMQIYGLVI
jgi:hypothetical protein